VPFFGLQSGLGGGGGMPPLPLAAPDEPPEPRVPPPEPPPAGVAPRLPPDAGGWPGEPPLPPPLPPGAGPDPPVPPVGPPPAGPPWEPPDLPGEPPPEGVPPPECLVPADEKYGFQSRCRSAATIHGEWQAGPFRRRAPNPARQAFGSQIKRRANPRRPVFFAAPPNLPSLPGSGNRQSDFTWAVLLGEEVLHAGTFFA